MHALPRLPVRLGMLPICVPECPLQINVGAVNRFISAAVPDLSGDQKAALKAASGKRPAASASLATQAEGAQDAADAAEAFLRDALGQGGDGCAPQQKRRRG